MIEPTKTSLFRSLGVFLAGVTWSLNSVFSQIHIDISKYDSENGLFFLDENQSTILTDLNRLRAKIRVEGAYDGQVIVNGIENTFIFETKDSQCEFDLALNDGVNELKARWYDGFYHTEERQIIRLQPSSLEEIQFKVGEKIVSSIPLESKVSEPIKTTIPSIVLVGSSKTAEWARLNAESGSGQPILVRESEGRFEVPYTLRAGENTILIETKYQNLVLSSQKLTFTLSNPINLQPASYLSYRGFSQRDGSDKRISTQLKNFFFQGTVEALAEGTVTISTSDVELKLPIHDHKFSGSIELKENSSHTLKASVEINGHTYFDYLVVSHQHSDIEIENVISSHINGQQYVDGEILERVEGGGFKSLSPVIRLKGRYSFKGSLIAQLRNTKTDAAIWLGDESGPFDVFVPLNLGDNHFEFVVSNGTRSIILKTLNVQFEDPIQITSVNRLPVNSTPVRVARNEVTIAGIIPCLERGILHLRWKNNDMNIPVLDGRFELDTPLSLPSGREHRITLIFKHKDKEYTESLSLVVP